MPTPPSLLATVRALMLAIAALVLAPSAQAETPLPNGYVTDGDVVATAVDGEGRTYIGGGFTVVGPRTGSAVAATTESDALGSFPEVNGSVLAAEPDGGGGWFIGGSFTTVGGQPRANLAHVNADGTLDAGWKADTNNLVTSLARAGDQLYVGGRFGEVAGQPRTKLARLSVSGGAVDAGWYPSVAGNVSVLELDGSTLYVGGTLSSIGGNFCFNVCRMPTSASAADATWAPLVLGEVRAMAIASGSVYVGGAIDMVQGESRELIAKLSTAAGAALDMTWNPDAAGASVNALAIDGSSLYAGGVFGMIGGQPRDGLARLSTTGTGAADSWQPPLFGNVYSLQVVGGQLYVGGWIYPSSGDADVLRHAVRVSTSTGALDSWSPRPSGEVSVLAVSGGRVLAGGSFSSAGPQARERLGVARFLPDGSLDPAWKPRLPSTKALLVSGSTLYVGGFFSLPGHDNLVKVSLDGAGAVNPTWAPPVSFAQSVTALALHGGSIFVGHGPPIGDGDDPGMPDSLGKYDAGGTGAKDATWAPDVFGAVRALAVTGDGSLIVGGDFQGGFGASDRTGLAKVPTSGSGAADATWNPQAQGGSVRTMVLVGDTLYVGGKFTQIAGVARDHVARLSVNGTGAVDPAWAPNPNNAVRAIAVDGDSVWLGGEFSTIAGTNRARLAKVSSAAPAVVDGFSVPLSRGVRTILPTSGVLTVGGVFSSVGTDPASFLAVFDRLAPSVTLTTPADGASYTQGQAVIATYSCSDQAPGKLSGCTGTVAAGAAVDTAAVGSKTFTVTATDTAGHVTTRTVSYNVVAAPPAPPAPSGPPAPPDAVLPALTTAVVPSGAFKAAGSGPSAVPAKGSKPKGVRITLTLSESATITGTVFTLKTVKKKGKKRTVKGKKVGSFSIALGSGKQRFDFTGRIGGKKLKPGSYLLELVAADASGNRSPTISKKIKIKR